MKSDAEVRLYMKERSKGRTQAQAAAKAGMTRGTARKYERAARLPSQLTQPLRHRAVAVADTFDMTSAAATVSPLSPTGGRMTIDATIVTRHKRFGDVACVGFVTRSCSLPV